MLKEIALLTPIYVSLFWGLFFFIQIGNTDKSKMNMGIFMAVAFLLYCSHAIFFNNLYELYSYIEGVYIFSMLSLYPLYYVYLLSLTSKKLIYKQYIIHFIPALVFSLAAFIMVLVLTPEEQIIYVKEILIDKNLKGLNLSTLAGIKGLIFFLSRAVLLIQIAYYLIKGILIANKHNQQIVNYYSNTEGKTLNWVKLLNIAFLIVSASSITLVFLGRSYFVQHEASLLFPSIIFSAFIFTIGFKGSRQVHINYDFNDDEITSYSTGTKEGQTEILKKQLIQLFEDIKVYKNSELRITTVSESLQTNRTYISKLINEEFQMNFNEFVNKYRIDEAKKLLSENNLDVFTMEHIAERSGFGSVNSFTRAFKTMVGMPPSKYKRR
jgi:AraC-like DNA-binding protein